MTAFGSQTGLRLAGLRLAGSALIPRTRIGRALAVVGGVDSCGTGMYLTIAALYATGVLGFEPLAVGEALTVGSVVGLLGTYPIGILADRWGTGRMLIAVQAVRVVAFGGYCLVGSYSPFLVVVGVISLTDATVVPLTGAVIGAAVPAQERLDTMAKIRAVRNLGFGIGALLAAVVLEVGSRAGFVVVIAANALSFLFTAIRLWQLGLGRTASRPDGAPQSLRPAWPGRQYVVLAAANGALTFHMSLLSLGLPLWIASRTSAPVGLVGVAVAVNTALVVVLQSRLARTANTLGGAARAMARSGVSLAVFCLLLLLASALQSAWAATTTMIVAVVALTFGEMWQSSGEWRLSYDLADPQRRAEYLSVFQLGASVQQVVAPVVITGLVLTHAWAVAGLGLSLALAGGAVVAVAKSGTARHRRPARPARHRQAGRPARPPPWNRQAGRPARPPPWNHHDEYRNQENWPVLTRPDSTSSLLKERPCPSRPSRSPTLRCSPPSTSRRCSTSSATGSPSTSSRRRHRQRAPCATGSPRTGYSPRRRPGSGAPGTSSPTCSTWTSCTGSGGG